MQSEELEKKVLTRARNIIYRFLTYRPRSKKEIIRKLQEKEFDDAIIEDVLAGLERLGYVNDRQFADQWATSRVRLRGFGRRRIEQELKQKGIDREVIQQTLAEVCGNDAEVETAMQAADRKLRTMSSMPPEVCRRRLAGFLERKGFSSETIRAIINADRNWLQ